MEIFALIILALFGLLGLAGLIFNFLGTFWIAAGAVIYAFMTGFESLKAGDLLFLVSLYLFGEIMDWVMVALGAKKFGATTSAMWGSLVGGIIGSAAGAMFFGIGMIPGLLLGVFLGAFIFQYRSHGNFMQAARAGAGSGIGFMISWGLKFVLAFIMTGWIVYRILSAVYS
jgi:uncharacterized protein